MAVCAEVLIDAESVMSLLVKPSREGRELSTATGFVVSVDDQPYLVTNWHVVSGRNPLTGQPLNSRTGALPDSLAIQHNVHGRLGEWTERIEPTVDDGGDPLWLEHPVHGRDVDVICLPLTHRDVALMPYPVVPPPAKLKVGPADGVSIIGFPFGRSAGLSFGIWVKGWIASEPRYDHDGLPRFLIDSRTRQGLSGAPVVAHSPDGAPRIFEDPQSWMPQPGAVTQLLGVYSGRISEESDIGIVWRTEVIMQIIESGRRGSRDHLPSPEGGGGPR
jgi:hypothetical protein